jgi:hypothetical protein
MQIFARTSADLARPPRKTSKLGKASLVIAIAIFFLVAGSIVVMILFAERLTPSAGSIVILTVVGWLLAPAGHLVGLVLGVVDLFRPRSKKLVPALGVAGNAILSGVGVTALIFLVNLLLRSAGGFH